MKLTFSFSTKIGDYGGGRYTKDNKTDHVLDLYKISMERAKSLGHSIKFYGCEYSLKYLNGYYDEFINVDNINFQITDDLKIYIHSQETLDCITFDGDIILENKLCIDETCDILFEQNEKFKLESPWQIETLFRIIDVFKKYKVNEIFPNFSFSPQCLFNVGILKFGNQKTKDLFIKSYYEMKRYYLENIEPHEKLISQGLIVSTVICQYYFTSICKIQDIKFNFTENNDKNKYRHYFGNFKFEPNILKKLRPTII